MDFYTRLQFTVMAPGTAALIAAVAYGVAKLKQHAGGQNWSLKALTGVLWLSYPAISLRSLQIFVCTEVEGVSLLEADYRLECSGDRYAHVLWLIHRGSLLDGRFVCGCCWF